MVQMIINKHAEDYDAVILTGTAYRTLIHMNSGDLNKKHKHLGTTGFEWLSRDENTATAFVDDPLTFYANAAKLFGIIDGLRLVGRPGKKLSKDLPLLIMIGSEDSVGGVRSVEALAAAYLKRSRLTDVELVVYTDARHELWNELNRDEFVSDLVEWLDDRLT
jgi:alpha-beta hydrolase superfamily lysophospholipase